MENKIVYSVNSTKGVHGVTYQNGSKGTERLEDVLHNYEEPLKVALSGATEVHYVRDELLCFYDGENSFSLTQMYDSTFSYELYYESSSTEWLGDANLPFNPKQQTIEEVANMLLKDLKERSC